MRSWLVRCSLVVLVGGVAAACGGDQAASPTTVAAPATTTTTRPPPTAEQLLPLLLTPEEVGPGFTSAPALVGQRSGDVAGRPLCDIRREGGDDGVFVTVGPIVDEGAREQVFERISIDADPSAYLAVVRRRAEAGCSYEETAGNGVSYRVKVDGPVPLGDVGDEAAGFSQTYTDGYDGFRWDMTARTGRLVVNVQHTSTSPIDPARARGLLAAAVGKAAPLG